MSAFQKAQKLPNKKAGKSVKIIKKDTRKMYAKQNQTEHLCLIKMSMMMTHKKKQQQKELSKYLGTKKIKTKHR